MSAIPGEPPDSVANRPGHGARASLLHWGPAGIVLVLALVVLGHRDYSLFHAGCEMAIAAGYWGLAIAVWSGRRLGTPVALAAFGAAAVFLGLLHVLHMLAYADVGALTGGVSVSTQARFWVGLRGLTAIALLLFALWLRRPPRLPVVWGGFAGAALLLVFVVPACRFIPACYVPGEGVTPFKQGAEIVVIALLLVAAGVLYRHRDALAAPVAKLLLAAVVMTAVAEVPLMAYATPDDTYHLTGHVLALLAVCMLYSAFVRAGLTDPQALLLQRYRDEAAAHEQAVRQYRRLLEETQQGVVYRDARGTIVSANPAAQRLVGLSLAQMRGEAAAPPGWAMVGEDGVPLAADQAAGILALRTGQAVRGQLLGFRHGAGTEPLWALADATPDWASGEAQPAGSYGTLTDVTDRVRAEHLLRDSTERYRAMFEDHAAMQFIMDPASGHIVDANGAAAAFYGWSRDELRSKNISEISTLSPLERTAALADVRDGIQTRFEVKHRRADGSVRDMVVYSSPIRARDQRLLHSIVHDVTELRRAEAALEESRALFAAAFEASPDLMIIKDRDLVLRAVNPATCQFMGKAAAEIIGRTDFELFPPGEAAQYRHNVRELVDTPQTVESDMLVTGKDGPRWFHVVKTTIADTDGDFVGVLIVCRDIAQRRSAEEALRQSEAWLRQVSESLPALVWASTPAGETVYTNPQYQEFAGRSAEAMAGFGWIESLHPDDRDRLIASWRAASAVGEPWQAEGRLQRHDGVYRWFAAHAVPLRDAEGQVITWFGMAMDIEALKQAQEALAHHAALSDTTSHIEELYLSGADVESVMGAYLRAVLELTASPLGFIAEVETATDEDRPGEVRLVPLATNHPPWAEAVAASLPSVAGQPGLCAGPVFAGTREIRNDLDRTPPPGLSAGASTLTSLMGLPVQFGDEVLGVVCLANREGGYREETAALLEPLLVAGAAIIMDLRRSRREADYLAQLQTSEKEFRSLFEMMEQGAFYQHRDLTLGRTNPAAQRILGLSAAELQRRLPHDPPWVMLDEHLQPLPADMLPSRMALHTGAPVRDILVGVRGGGSEGVRWLQTGAYPEFRPGETEPFRALTIFTDVTARRQVELRLQETRDRLQYALEATNEGVWDWDLRNDHMFCSEHWLASLGYAREETNDDIAFLMDITHPDDRERVRAALAAHLQGQTAVYSCEHRLRCRSGEYVDMLAQGKVVAHDDAGTPTRLVGTYVDITERNRVNAELRHLSRRLVEAQEAERAHIAAELHDQIGQTLTGLTLLLEQHQGFTPEVVQARLDLARTEAKGLLGTIREMTLNLRPPLLDDLGLVEALRSLFRRFTTQTRVPVSFDPAFAEDELSEEMAVTIYRIVQEALTNVARHAEASHVGVAIDVVADEVHVQVSDDGRGFRPEQARGRSAGLSVMRERARAFGGEVDVMSGAGEGTTIEARLPGVSPGGDPAHD